MFIIYLYDLYHNNVIVFGTRKNTFYNTTIYFLQNHAVTLESNVVINIQKYFNIFEFKYEFMCMLLHIFIYLFTYVRIL